MTSLIIFDLFHANKFMKLFIPRIFRIKINHFFSILEKNLNQFKAIGNRCVQIYI